LNNRALKIGIRFMNCDNRSLCNALFILFIVLFILIILMLFPPNFVFPELFSCKKTDFLSKILFIMAVHLIYNQIINV